MDYSLQTTLAITQAMTDELVDYLMGDSLYRQLVVKTPDGVRQPKMTLGALLEAVQQLDWQRPQLNPAQRQQLTAIEERIAVARASFAAAWDSLLRRELKALLDSWKWYLDDVRENEAARDNYASEAHTRTRIELVQAALAASVPAESSYTDQDELDKLDRQLRGLLRRGQYVGPRGSESHYSADQAWWLYGRPAADD